MRIAMLYPPDMYTETVHPLHLLYFRVLEKLQADHDVTVFGRIPEEHFRKTVPVNLKYVCIFEHYEFDESRNVTSKTTPVAEAAACMPFQHMHFCCRRRWGWYGEPNPDRLAKYVYAWSALLEGYDVLIPSFDNLYFIYTAIGVARTMDIKVAKFIRGRLINDSVVFWDEENKPIYYKADTSGGETYLRFIERNTNRAKVLKDSKAFSNPAGDGLASFRKLFRYGRGGYPADMDLPEPHVKYPRLVSMAVRTRLYPAIHSLCYTKPRQGERYFLFPLHFEWEANLTYREPFLDQLALARRIAGMLPLGTQLYVKMHPHWKGCDLGIGDVINTFTTNNIRVIAPEADTSALIANSLGVIVINGTVGYEAMAARKPTVVLGHEAYREGATVVDDLTMLPEVLLDIADGGASPSTVLYEPFLRKYASVVTPIDGFDKLVMETMFMLDYLAK